MGIYKYYQKYNNYPSYYGPGGRRLYFLIGSGWLIGPTLGNPTGYIHNRGASINDTGTERSHPYHVYISKFYLTRHDPYSIKIQKIINPDI